MAATAKERTEADQAGRRVRGLPRTLGGELVALRVLLLNRHWDGLGCVHAGDSLAVHGSQVQAPEPGWVAYSGTDAVSAVRFRSVHLDLGSALEFGGGHRFESIPVGDTDRRRDWQRKTAQRRKHLLSEQHASIQTRTFEDDQKLDSRITSTKDLIEIALPPERGSNRHRSRTNHPIRDLMTTSGMKLLDAVEIDVDQGKWNFAPQCHCQLAIEPALTPQAGQRVVAGGLFERDKLVTRFDLMGSLFCSQRTELDGSPNHEPAQRQHCERQEEFY